MSYKAARIGLTTLVLLTAFGVLLFTTMGESMQYYKYVDEVMAQPDQWQGKKLQVHGNVVPGSRMMIPDSLDYVFDLHRNGKTIKAYYTGVVPDTFKDNAEVVLTGALQPDGSFKATEMTAKCPSKYEEAPASLGTSGVK
jgi:cytochrome c-type biogenesis protein CcmE